MSPVISLFGMKIDAVDMAVAVDRVLVWCAEPRVEKCRYVVTPNVDHAVMFQTDADLQQAYAGAAMVLADGAPVVLASRLLRKALPERVAGSDLVPALFEAVSQKSSDSTQPLRVFLLGAGPGVADRAADVIHDRWRGVEVVGTLSPPMGFEHDESENQQILQSVADCQPDLVLIGLGAPKQELWIGRHADQLQARAALCIGATIDFIAGEKSRAPRIMQKLGLEWIHRVATEPKRLAKRYARDAWVFPQLILGEWKNGKAELEP